MQAISIKYYCFNCSVPHPAHAHRGMETRRIIITIKIISTLALNRLYHLTRGPDRAALSILSFVERFSKLGTGYIKSSRGLGGNEEVLLQFFLSVLLSHLAFRAAFIIDSTEMLVMMPSSYKTASLL